MYIVHKLNILYETRRYTRDLSTVSYPVFTVGLYTNQFALTLLVYCIIVVKSSNFHTRYKIIVLNLLG